MDLEESSRSFRAERAVSPLDGSELWVVLGPELVIHAEATDFCRALEGASRSTNTVRAYSSRVAAFLTWCEARGINSATVSLADLARFKHWLEATPTAKGRPRFGSTVNAILTAVCEFLRFCAAAGHIDPSVADRLSERRYLHYTPPGFDPGEQGQFRRVRARALRARAEVPSPETLTPEQAQVLLGACRNPRETFLVTLLLGTGMRIGEALGLHREDMHLLPDSRRLGCSVIGAHVHVRRRANPNGALVKSRHPRSVPATEAILAAYADYRYEREACWVTTAATSCWSTSTTSRSEPPSPTGRPSRHSSGWPRSVALPCGRTCSATRRPRPG